MQRVSRACVAWEGGRSEIGQGLLVLVGVGPTDTRDTVLRVADRLTQIRLFEDDEGRANLSLLDVGGAALVVSQFTLYADLSRGRRPGFAGAANAELARPLYEELIRALGERGVPTRGGRFGSEMDVELVNQGPFTLVIDTDTLGW